MDQGEAEMNCWLCEGLQTGDTARTVNVLEVFTAGDPSVQVRMSMTRIKEGEERVYLAYTSTSQSTIKGSQDRNSDRI